MNFYNNDNIKAVDARSKAYLISFAPIVFQVTRIMVDSGILAEIRDSKKTGLTLEEIVEGKNMSLYGVRVLLEASLGTGLIYMNDDRYLIGKTGVFILNQEAIKINMDFVHDVCYKSMFYLDESIQNGKPEGLKQLGEWNTIYDGLSELPEQIKTSWFNFDHYFSDDAFPVALPIILQEKPKKVMDIGGNTGKFAIKLAALDPDVNITIVDLPGQIGMAKENIKREGLSDRVSFHAMNVLDESSVIPGGFDVIWMSQFLDCFSEEENTAILKKIASGMSEDSTIYILEEFWDKQRLEVASFSLQQLSLYFTAIANGNSQMYDSKVFFRCIEKAGLKIENEWNDLGLSTTLLKVKKA
ncbi:class I SAM-dependent methyltransferase [Marivirga sp. S37H4]|uniref:Class I SAM-dependent methyltransferase n=1 Tax=Marivirga aurantiaca TaxID=2802615 RepID=A0A935C878_9BACT|nr:class I SAM-dependent methyltransferase [Marivirga aurantiaca]MBK6265314.1 class I SAM-dependent methyltransferase [Marivirga aurantiaca]